MFLLGYVIMANRQEYIPQSGFAYGGTAEAFIKSVRTSMELPQDPSAQTPEEVSRRVKGYEIIDGQAVLSDTLCTKVATNLLEAVGYTAKSQITIQFMSQNNASWQVIQRIRELAEAAGKRVVTFDLGNRERELLLDIDNQLQKGTMTPEDARRELVNYSRYEADLLGEDRKHTGVICFRDELPYLYDGISADVRALRDKTRKPALDIRVDKRDWTLDVMDTQDLVDVDNHNLAGHESPQTLEDYLRRWVANERRNHWEVLGAHETLLSTLNRAHRFRVVDYALGADTQDVATHVTDLTLVTRIKEGEGYRPRLWYNQAGGPSKNTGSEVFVGPSSDEDAASFADGAVHGKITFQGAVTYVGKTIPPGLSVTFENGQMVDWVLPGDSDEVNEARAWIERFSKDEGMVRLGELGYGTNPIFRIDPNNPYKGRATRNVLESEKAGLHIAFGKCYENEEDESRQITGEVRISDLDNGNVSPHHEDLVHSQVAGIISDKWADIGEYDAEGVYTPQWVLVERNGVFLEREMINGQWVYKPSEAMRILSSPFTSVESFTAEFPAVA